MKKIMIAVLAAATVIAGATVVSASGMHHMGTGHRTGICTVEDCPYYGQMGWHVHSGGHHRNYGEGHHGYCHY